MSESVGEQLSFWALVIVWCSACVALQGLAWWGIFWALGIV